MRETSSSRVKRRRWRHKAAILQFRIFHKPHPPASNQSHQRTGPKPAAVDPPGPVTHCLPHNSNNSGVNTQFVPFAPPLITGIRGQVSKVQTPFPSHTGVGTTSQPASLPLPTPPSAHFLLLLLTIDAINHKAPLCRKGLSQNFAANSC